MIKFIKKIRQKMAEKKIDQMTEQELIRYVNDLQREVDSDRVYDSKIDRGSISPIENIRELTRARNALKTIRRKGLTEEEKREFMKLHMSFECANCKKLHRRDKKIIIDNKGYCRSCAAKKLSDE
jgi:Zn finger protein HypA/HybF involved in hydrogenase expression